MNGKRKRIWMRDIFLNRETKGAYSMLMQEMMLKDLESFRQYLRMSTDVFQVYGHFRWSRMSEYSAIDWKKLFVYHQC